MREFWRWQTRGYAVTVSIRFACVIVDHVQMPGLICGQEGHAMRWEARELPANCRRQVDGVRRFRSRPCGSSAHQIRRILAGSPDFPVRSSGAFTAPHLLAFALIKLEKTPGRTLGLHDHDGRRTLLHSSSIEESFDD